MYLNQPRKAWKGANGEKAGNCDSATPLLHWLKLPKGKQKPLKTASSAGPF
jgi:hypothetical protein